MQGRSNGEAEDGAADATVGHVAGANPERIATRQQLGAAATAIEQADLDEANFTGAAAHLGPAPRGRLARRTRVDRADVGPPHVLGPPLGPDAAAIEPEGLAAESAHVPHVVRDEDDGAAFADELLHLIDRPPLKGA